MMRSLTRIAVALERIASALEIKPTNTVIRVDGKELARVVTRETLNSAKWAPSSLVGGSLATVRKPSTMTFDNGDAA